MIKINLLDSITERRLGRAMVVERRVSSPESKFLLMTLAVAGLLIAVIAWDIISTQMAKTAAQEELARQQEIARQLESVMKEQQELEAKINNIDTRINAIKRLRESQAGPSAVLEALRERISMTPGIYLESVEQKGAQLTIKGDSPDENAVTQFGRSLEFSSGLFTNLNIETQRKDLTQTGATVPDVGRGVVAFTIKCGYAASKGNQSLSAPAGATSASTGTVQPAATTPAPAAGAQPNTAKPATATSAAAAAAAQTSPSQVAKNN